MGGSPNKLNFDTFDPRRYGRGRGSFWFYGRFYRYVLASRGYSEGLWRPDGGAALYMGET